MMITMYSSNQKHNFFTTTTTMNSYIYNDDRRVKTQVNINLECIIFGVQLNKKWCTVVSIDSVPFTCKCMATCH